MGFSRNRPLRKKPFHVEGVRPSARQWEKSAVEEQPAPVSGDSDPRIGSSLSLGRFNAQRGRRTGGHLRGNASRASFARGSYRPMKEGSRLGRKKSSRVIRKILGKINTINAEKRLFSEKVAVNADARRGRGRKTEGDSDYQ